MTKATGLLNPVVRHSECKGKGGAKCLWEIKWAALQT
jgi:hypothetical protein